MKIALTGASGHLGAAIARELLNRQHAVSALIRDDERAIRGLAISKIKGDLFSDPALDLLMKDCEVVIHGAGLISIHGGVHGLVHQTNVVGTRKIVNAALRNGVRRLIHFSSIHAFQQLPRDEVLNEKRRLVEDEAYAYDRSKRDGQQLVLEANGNQLETIVLNPTAIVGPPDYKPSLIGKAIIDLYKGRIPAVTEGGFDFCDSRDIAMACCEALSRGKTGEIYLLGGKWYSMKSFAGILSGVSGKKLKVYNLPVSLAKAGLPFVKGWSMVTRNEPLYTHESIAALVTGNRMISYDKAKHDLQYSVRPFENTMLDTWTWFRENKYL